MARNFTVRRGGKQDVLAVGTERDDSSVEAICAGVWREGRSLGQLLVDLEGLSTTGVEVEWHDG